MENDAVKFCCNEFKEAVGEKRVEKSESSKVWHVGGCCGGGCYVITDMKYCPFCGKKFE